MSIYGTAADTIIVVFCIDEEIQKHHLGKDGAQHCPAELREFIDEHEESTKWVYLVWILTNKFLYIFFFEVYFINFDVKNAKIYKLQILNKPNYFKSWFSTY